MTTSTTYSIHEQASISVRPIVLPRAKWEFAETADGLALRPQKGTWYGHVMRGRAAHDVQVVPMLGCPACGHTLYLSHSDEAAKWLGARFGHAVPVAHRINHLGKVSPDIRCQHGRCGFHRQVYLDRWLKTKPLYAIAYVEGAHGKIVIDYTHAIDRKEALFHFGARKNVRIIDMAPAVGYFVDEKTGRMTAD